MEWLYGLLGAAFLALVGAVWKLMNDKMKEHRDECQKDISAIWNQIGRDSGSGMRYKVHNSTPMGAHMELEKRVTTLERHVLPGER